MFIGAVSEIMKPILSEYYGSITVVLRKYYGSITEGKKGQRKVMGRRKTENCECVFSAVLHNQVDVFIVS